MRIAAVDIETTDLKALMGGVLCCSFHPIALSPEYTRKLKPYTLRLDDKKYRNPTDWEDDSLLITAVAREIEKYELIVTWNGKMFDIPFLKAKLAEYGEGPIATKWHLDAMWIVRNGMRIGSSKLINVQKFLNLGEQKTEITWKDWRKAGRGVRGSMNVVVEHCEADVKVLAEAYWRLLPFVKNLRRDS